MNERMVKRFPDDGTWKYREKGIFKSEKRARAYAEKLKARGLKVRVEHHELPCYGGAAICGKCWSVRIWCRNQPWGRNYRIDTRKE